MLSSVDFRKEQDKHMRRRRGHAKRSSKGHVPLKVLEKRARRLNAIVKARGGKVS